MIISSPAYEQNQPIPEKYSCEGENINPPLAISGIPPEAKSLALIMDDPDVQSGTFVHWLVWNIGPQTSGISEAASSNLGVEGINSAGNTGYTGPCPPPGEEHRYFFRLYALDSMLSLPPGSTHAQLNQAMGGRILAQVEIWGIYKRRS